jgi:hypothetical protein
MGRSEAQRRYNNLIQYQLRPMVADRKMSDENRINALKRIVREASRFKYESGMVAGAGAREEIVELTADLMKPENPVSDEVRDWIKRAIHAFGASVDKGE